jgi:hypothetical protein
MIYLAKYIAVTLSIAVVFLALHVVIGFRSLSRRYKELKKDGQPLTKLNMNGFPFYVYVLLAMPFAAVIVLYAG